MSEHEALLEVRDLRMHYHTTRGYVRAVDGVTFSLKRGEALALVGESGSGKTATALTIMGLQGSGKVAGGSVLLDGTDLTRLPGGKMRRVRGKEISMVFQQPRSALNPVKKVGAQIVEAIRAHTKTSKPEARRIATETLRRLGLPEPELIMQRYPFELSGGMAQRVVIAIALVLKPRLLIADEPTTALDVTTQAQILRWLKQLLVETNTSVLYITHDLAVASELADEIAVMYAGKIVEIAKKEAFFKGPKHPYSQALLQAIPVSQRYTALYQIPGDVPDMLSPPSGCRFNPRCPYAQDRCRQEEPLLMDSGEGNLVACHYWNEIEEMSVKSGSSTPAAGLVEVTGGAPDAPNAVSENRILEVRGLSKVFPIQLGIIHRSTKTVKAVSDVSFFVREGETFGVVGESGCGKTTLGRTLIRLIEPTSGSIEFSGKQITKLGKSELMQLRKQMQIIFQDPYSALHPRKTVESIVSEPLRVHKLGSKQEIRDAVSFMIKSVGLTEEHLQRYPHELSGGQRQRVVIARALILGPRLLVLDEPTSSLDASVQALTLNLLRGLQKERGLTYLLISHHMSVVEYLSDRIAVMYLGKIVELGPKAELFARPLHPYSKALLSSIPKIVGDETGSERITLTGEVPSPVNPPSGCSFHSRCVYAQNLCSTKEPLLEEAGSGRYVACHFWQEIQERQRRPAAATSPPLEGKTQRIPLQNPN